MNTMTRDYSTIAAAMSRRGSRSERMQRVVDALWTAFDDAGYSWVGFYIEQPDAPESERLVLGPRRDRPACSPIGLHGACGRAFTTNQSLVVHDVAELGDAYVACDPRDRSEIVIPIRDETGRVDGVLDVDSWDVGAFDERDDAGLRLVLDASGLL